MDKEGLRIQKLASDGRLLLEWGDKEKANGQLRYASGITTGKEGNVYVADCGNNCILVFSSRGKFITKFGEKGKNGGQFELVHGIGCDRKDNIYVLTDGRVQKFNSDGTFISQWGKYAMVSNMSSSEIKTNCRGDGQFYNPEGIAIDSLGNVYIADSGNSRIQKFDPKWKFIAKWGTMKFDIGMFYPAGVAVDDADNIYVVDRVSNLISRFNSDGKLITKWGKEGSDKGEFKNPCGVAVDSKGNVYVADTGNNRIQIFRPKKENNPEETKGK